MIKSVVLLILLASCIGSASAGEEVETVEVSTIQVFNVFKSRVSANYRLYRTQADKKYVCFMLFNVGDGTFAQMICVPN